MWCNHRQGRVLGLGFALPAAVSHLLTLALHAVRAVPALQDYEAFWESFGRYIKLGCIEDGVSGQPCPTPMPRPPLSEPAPSSSLQWQPAPLLAALATVLAGRSKPLVLRSALPLPTTTATNTTHPTPPYSHNTPSLLPQDNREALAKLLRFPSSATAAEEGLTSLADYVARKKEGQTQIYYLAGGFCDRTAVSRTVLHCKHRTAFMGGPPAEPLCCWPADCSAGRLSWPTQPAALALLKLLCARCHRAFICTRRRPLPFHRQPPNPPLPPAADTKAAAEASPYVEALTSKG